eukprot:822354-Amphidinium_carterae.1
MFLDRMVGKEKSTVFSLAAWFRGLSCPDLLLAAQAPKTPKVLCESGAHCFGRLTTLQKQATSPNQFSAGGNK